MFFPDETSGCRVNFDGFYRKIDKPATSSLSFPRKSVAGKNAKQVAYERSDARSLALDRRRTAN